MSYRWVCRRAGHAGHTPQTAMGVTTRAVVTVVLAGMLLAACGNGSPAAGPATTAGPAPSTRSLAPTTTHDPAATEVIAAYRAAWAAFDHALADADPKDPALAATMVDPQLVGVRANLVGDQQHGIVGRGLTTLHPKIAVFSTGTATVVDCVYSADELVYAKTGMPVPPITPPENDGVRATLVLTGGTWKVSKQTVTDGKCAPGS